MQIHATAIVEEGADLGADITIGPFCYVQKDVRLGTGCVLKAHVTVYAYTTLGAHCRVHAGAVLGDVPQDLGFDAETVSYVTIGDNCVMREGFTIHRGTEKETGTIVGNNCYFMANSHVAHNCRVGNGVILANGVPLGGYVEVGDQAFLSGNAVVHQFCRIGRLAMVGGLTGANVDVPPFVMTSSVSRGKVAGINVVGLRRAGMRPEERKAVKQAYKLLYLSGLNTSQAVDAIRRDLPDGPAREMADFAAASRRGIGSAARRAEG